MDVAEVVDCLLRVNHLCLEIELLAETLLEVIKEFVEVNALVVVVEAGFIGHLCQSPDNEQVKFGLNPKVWVLYFESHHFTCFSILDFVDLGKTR